MFKAACCMAASVILFLPVAYWLYSVAPVSPAAEQAAVADRFVSPEGCCPQPGERLVYFGGIVFLPVSLFGLAFVWRRYQGRLPTSHVLLWGLEIVFAAALAVLAWKMLRRNEYYHLQLNQFFLQPFLALVLLPASLAAMQWNWGGKRLGRWALHLAASGIVGVVFLGSILSNKIPYTGHNHFNVVFFPVVQVYEGKALLINCVSQYGLYPQLLQPLFSITGLSIFTFTLVMGLLTAGSYIALWAFLVRACENRLAAFVGFAALLFNCWFSYLAHSGRFDLYFQYYPIRFIFPAVMVLLTWRQLRRPTRPLYWGLLVFLSVGVLWNLDGGLPSLLAWTATLCFAELFGDERPGVARRVIGHLAASAGVLTAVVAIYSGVIRLRYGAFPDYGQIFKYQSLYFVAGFCKLPMNPPSTWVLVGLVYLAGIAYSAFALTARQGTPRAKMVFLLSVLGVGLSSYYQGRSHPIIILLVWWPCLLLLTLFLDELLLRLKENPARLLPWFATAFIAWFLVGSAYSLAPELCLVGKKIRVDYRITRDRKAPWQRQEEAALLKRVVPVGEKVVVASRYAASLHLASKRPALNAASLPDQMILMEEYRRLDDLLAQSPSTLVLIDRPLLALENETAEHRGMRKLVDLLRKRYEVAGATTLSVLFARRQAGEYLLGDDDAAVLHIGARDDTPRAGLSFEPISIQPPWSLEMVIKQAEAQGPFAALAVNQGFGINGLVIHQESPGVWALMVGDGKVYQPILHFSLQPGKWNYLAVVHAVDAFTVYLDGAPIASRPLNGLPIACSPLPLQIGNGAQNNPPFNGNCREIRLVNRALAPEEIAAAARNVRAKLP